jgi:hypothetical protein
MIPWLWVLEWVGVQLRLIEAKNGMLDIRHELVSEVTVLAMKCETRSEMFPLKRYKEGSTKRFKLIDETAEGWTLRAQEFFGGQASPYPLGFLRHRIKDIISHPEYLKFGNELGIVFIKQSIAKLKSFTKRKTEFYNIGVDNWYQVTLYTPLDLQLLRLLCPEAESTKARVVLVNNSWQLQVLK